MKMEEYITQKTAKLKEMKLSELLQEASEPLLQDTGKKFQYVVGSVLDKAKEKAVEMETAVATDDKPLKERSVSNRIKSFMYYNFSNPVDSENLYINGSRHWANTPFFTRLKESFPNVPTVMMLSPKERVQEIIRIQKMVLKICKVNNLPVIKFDIYDKAGKDKNSEKKNFGAYAYEGKFYICPLNTKYMSDNQLAYVVSHEMAHVLAGHSSCGKYHTFNNDYLFFNAMKNTVCKKEWDTAVKEAVGKNVSPSELFAKTEPYISLYNGMRRYQEYEADILGVGFMRKAGYEYRTDEKAVKKAMLDDEASIYGAEHASSVERRFYVRNYDYSKFHFSYEERARELVELSLNLDKNSNMVVNYFMKKINRFAKLDNESYMKRIDAVEKGKASDKIKALLWINNFTPIGKKDIINRNNVFCKIYSYNEHKKMEYLQGIGKRIEDSISRKDYAMFYMKRALEMPKIDLAVSAYLGAIRFGYELGSDAYKKMKRQSNKVFNINRQTGAER